jgi:hypothetical protein
MENLIIWVVLVKIKTILLQKFLPLSEVDIQGLLHPAEANLDIFLRGFSLSSCHQTQSESPLALIPLAPKSHYPLNCEQNCSYFDPD